MIRCFKKLWQFFFCLLAVSPVYAEIFSKHLSVISSANPESNAAQSFIIVKKGDFLKEGIKHDAKQTVIAQQTPFVIEYKGPVAPNETLHWKIKLTDKQHGTMELLSNFNGKGRLLNSGYEWNSEKLNKNHRERNKLIFRPKPFSHQPEVYKKGKGPQGQRRRYGGGTRNIDEKKYNPKFTYNVTLSIYQADTLISAHKAQLSMDKKDMIRQEYINHYDIKRYGRGDNGKIPVPKRDEIGLIPKRPVGLQGNPLTESQYKLIINDGMLELANKINQAYLNKIKALKKNNTLTDLNKKPLKIPKAKLWVTSGWRNPERNEWYSNAVNGIHQRGGAVDMIIMAPPGSMEASVGYWILWQALQSQKENIDAYWQLESNGRPMTTREFKLDVEPANGIPDAFDKADHLHANVNY